MATFLVLLFAYTLSQFFRAFLAIVAGDLARDAGLNAADLGAVSAIWFATFALAQFPVGWALDRFGPRRTLATFMVLAVAGAAWFTQAQNLTDCLVAMGLIGVGCSPVLMASLYVFGRVYPVERFAMLSSLMIGLGSAGNLLGATPLAFAVEAFGWRTAMAGIAAITALSVLIALLALKDPPHIEGQAGGGVLGGLGEVLRLRALWPILPLAVVSYAVVIATRSLWIGPYFREVHAFSVTERGNAALVMAVTMSIGALAYGPLERAVGSAKTTTLVGSVVTGFAFLALGLLGARDPRLALVLLALVGGFGMTYGILMAHARLFVPPHLLGRGVTFLNFAFIGGAGVLQWLSGHFVEGQRASGSAPDPIYGGLYIAFGAILLVSTAIYVFAPAKPERTLIPPAPVP